MPSYLCRVAGYDNRGLRRSESDMSIGDTNDLVLILLISFLAVAASLVAEDTNMRELPCLLPKSHLCVVSGLMELLPSLLRARLSAAAGNTLLTMLSSDRDAWLLQSFLAPLFLYTLLILESIMWCGTAPSCLHWQRTLRSGNSKVVLQCLIRSGEIRVPCLRPSCRPPCWVLLLTVLGLIHPWWAGIRWHIGLRETRCSLSGTDVRKTPDSVALISPSAGLCPWLSPHCMSWEGVLVEPSAFLMPSYIPLMFPDMAAVCVSWLSCVQYSFAALKNCRLLSLGDCLYSIRAVRGLYSMTGLISVDFASTQSWVFEVFFPNLARAVRCMVSRRIFHFSFLGCRAPSSLAKASAKCDMLLTSVRGFPCFLVRWNLFGCNLILQHPKEGSVLQYALW